LFTTHSEKLLETQPRQKTSKWQPTL